MDIGASKGLPPVPGTYCSSLHGSQVWTGTEVLCWGIDAGARYHVANSSWITMSVVNAPIWKDNHSFTWTGNGMIVWGGGDDYSSIYYNTGAWYNANTDSWTETTTTDAPSPRYMRKNYYNARATRYTRAVWTGDKMFIWGGLTASGVTNTGALYDPAADQWSPISTTNAPSARTGYLSVWTGDKVIVWGGAGADGSNALADGGVYDPATDSWMPMSNVDASGVGSEQAVWIGNEMAVTNYNSLSFYNPTTNTWRQSDAYLNSLGVVVDDTLLVGKNVIYDYSLDKIIATRDGYTSPMFWTGQTLLNDDMSLSSDIKIVLPYTKD